MSDQNRLKYHESHGADVKAKALQLVAANTAAREATLRAFRNEDLGLSAIESKNALKAIETAFNNIDAVLRPFSDNVDTGYAEIFNLDRMFAGKFSA